MNSFPAGFLVLFMGCGLCFGGAGPGPGFAVADRGVLTFESCDRATFKFDGVLGRRIDANVGQWLLRAPQANPGCWRCSSCGTDSRRRTSCPGRGNLLANTSSPPSRLCDCRLT